MREFIPKTTFNLHWRVQEVHVALLNYSIGRRKSSILLMRRSEKSVVQSIIFPARHLWLWWNVEYWGTRSKWTLPCSDNCLVEISCFVSGFFLSAVNQSLPKLAKHDSMSFMGICIEDFLLSKFLSIVKKKHIMIWWFLQNKYKIFTLLRYHLSKPNSAIIVFA